MDYIDFVKNTLYWPIKEWKYRRCLKKLLEQPVEEIKKIYYKNLHKELNLEAPNNLNEKIQWLKIYSDTSTWTRLSDKIAVRDYIKKMGLEDILLPIYGVWEKADDIDISTLPDSFVLKSNHGSGTVIVVDDKSKLDWRTTRYKMKNWLKTKYGAFSAEFHYLLISPRLYAEKLLVNDGKDDSSSIIDYKIFCIMGEPRCVQVYANRKKNYVEKATYDIQWRRRLDWSVQSEHYHIASREFHRPDNLSEMLDIARKLSKPHPQVRVDLYNCGGKVYFGELTFTAASGTIDSFTDDYLLELGSGIVLPPKDEKAFDRIRNQLKNGDNKKAKYCNPDLQ